MAYLVFRWQPYIPAVWFVEDILAAGRQSW
jgi:hypothetical protein